MVVSMFNSLFGKLKRGDAVPKVIKKIRTEYLLMLLMIAVVATLSVVFHTWIFVKLWFIPFLFSIPIHALVELPEHFGCDGQTPDVLRNTRSIRAGRLDRKSTRVN